MNKIAVLFFVLYALPSCRERTTDAQADLKWGHLDREDLRPSSPHYLINKARETTFKVCLAQYLRDQLPGIDQEIDTAVNVWASYIGRKIPVSIDVKDLPRAKTGDTEITLAKAYFAQCGKGYDVVIGLAPLQGQNVGLTGAFTSVLTNSDGSKTVVSFDRFLFLRDFDISPNTKAESPASWKSYAQKGGTVQSNTQLLSLMRSRQSRFYSLKKDFLTLSVLTHEMGHVWGLCDQYEGTPNCDKNNSSTHIEINSIMSSARFRQIAYLSDDDILGIRALAARPGFKHDWPDTPALTDTPSPVNLGSIEYFDIQSLTRNGNVLELNFGILSHVATKLSFSLVPASGTRESTLADDMISPDTGFDKPLIALSIGLPQGDNSTYNVRIQAFTKDAKGIWIRQKAAQTTSPK